LLYSSRTCGYTRSRTSGRCVCQPIQLSKNFFSPRLAECSEKCVGTIKNPASSAGCLRHTMTERRVARLVLSGVRTQPCSVRSHGHRWLDCILP
jgi:hypothetical protein